ncbi:MAG: PAS domain-containing protein, partial [Deltaproteobacteria bacterium]|nr:PAS domain-containing protein [Deltaproteobacteria bacterium]
SVAPSYNTPPPVVTPPNTPSPWPRTLIVRRLSYLMLLRVILFTLLLGGTVILHFISGRPEELGNPFITILFVFIAAIYGLNIVYAILLRIMRHLRVLAMAQISIDLITSALLVHFTGSAESAFVFLFLLSPIAAAVVLSKRAAISTAAASVSLFAMTVLLGYNHWLPILPGQTDLPWEIHEDTLGRTLLIISGATIAVAALGGYLADMLSSAASEVEEQHAVIADLTALHEDVVRCLTSGLVTLDKQDKILTLNAAAGEILKLDAQKAIGQSLATLVPPLGDLTLRNHDTRREEISLTKDGDPRFLGVSISPLVNRSGEELGRIVNLQDLTALRQMEQMVQRSEQLAALGRVAAGVAHELRNPLASISGSLELMQATEPTLASDTRKLMTIALREIERLDGLVKELLDHSRPRPETPLVRIDLGAKLAELIAAIAKLGADGDDTPNIHVDHTTPKTFIHADTSALTGLVWNLVRNAGEAGSATVHISVSRGHDAVLLQIKDEGSGISPDDVGHVFEPFYTTKSHGSGLGLATVHRTVRQHGGTIDVQSSPDAGTTFTISLPEAPAPETEDTKA